MKPESLQSKLEIKDYRAAYFRDKSKPGEVLFKNDTFSFLISVGKPHFENRALAAVIELFHHPKARPEWINYFVGCVIQRYTRVIELIKRGVNPAVLPRVEDLQEKESIEIALKACDQFFSHDEVKEFFNEAELKNKIDSFKGKKIAEPREEDGEEVWKTYADHLSSASSLFTSYHRRVRQFSEALYDYIALQLNNIDDVDRQQQGSTNEFSLIIDILHSCISKVYSPQMIDEDQKHKIMTLMIIAGSRCQGELYRKFHLYPFLENKLLKPEYEQKHSVLDWKTLYNDSNFIAYHKLLSNIFSHQSDLCAGTKNDYRSEEFLFNFFTGLEDVKKSKPKEAIEINEQSAFYHAVLGDALSYFSRSYRGNETLFEKGDIGYARARLQLAMSCAFRIEITAISLCLLQKENSKLVYVGHDDAPQALQWAYELLCRGQQNWLLSLPDELQQTACKLMSSRKPNQNKVPWLTVVQKDHVRAEKILSSFPSRSKITRELAQQKGGYSACALSQMITVDREELKSCEELEYIEKIEQDIINLHNHFFIEIEKAKAEIQDLIGRACHYSAKLAEANRLVNDKLGSNSSFDLSGELVQRAAQLKKLEEIDMHTPDNIPGTIWDSKYNKIRALNLYTMYLHEIYIQLSENRYKLMQYINNVSGYMFEQRHVVERSFMVDMMQKSHSDEEDSHNLSKSIFSKKSPEVIRPVLSDPGVVARQRHSLFKTFSDYYHPPKQVTRISCQS